MKCRFCSTDLHYELIDLANAPPSNSFLTNEDLNKPEVYYPLKIFVCDNCFLVQIDEYKKHDEIFNNEYVYFSSFSKTWLDHCSRFADLMIERFSLNKRSSIIEVASNDGYLLQYFKEKNIPVLGIEPSANTADKAIEKGIPTRKEFFNTNYANSLVSEGIKADLLIGNNVLAHVPGIKDFVNALKLILKKNGVISIEFPHVMQLMEQNQFDTIYHEHFSYFSFYTVSRIFNEYDLDIFDVDEIPTHGGSLRLLVKHINDNTKEITKNVTHLIDKEMAKGINTLGYYRDFQRQADTIKNKLLYFLLTQKQKDRRIIAYGAAAKGNTLLNYCGIKKDLIDFVVDKSPYKQGKYLPGSHIPVVAENEIKKARPDYVLILPWNIRGEIITQLSYIKDWGGKFIIAIPKLEIF